MKGDFTRDTFQSNKHYQRVLMQQGRVQLDADWNEQAAIASRRDETTASDIVGLCGGPAEGAAFRITPDAARPGDFQLSAGRYYVEGAQCELELAVFFSQQPDRRGLDPLTAGQYLIFLDVWQRHVTMHEDGDIRESALGGPDTATRIKMVWQVRAAALDVPLDLDNPPPDPCHQPATGFDQLQRVALPRLAAKTSQATPDTDPCTVSATSGYRGLENQLYRVEIHTPGALGSATFKWSRENGAVVTRISNNVVVPIDGANANRLTVSSTGPDDNLAFQTGSIVEILHESEELEGLPGKLALVDRVDDSTGEILLKQFGADSMPLAIDVTSNPRLRRWEGVGVVVADPAVNGGFVPLESGIEIKFDQPVGATFATGDFWKIAARSASPEAQAGRIEWPSEGGVAEFLPPKGIAHHYCRLGVVSVSADGTLSTVGDCRCLWPALTAVPRLFYVSGDGQEVMPDLTAAAGARFKLPRPLIVGAANAHCLERAMHVRFDVVNTPTSVSDGLVVVSEGVPSHSTADISLDADGLAKCDFHLDGIHPTQQVAARFLDAGGDPVSLPVIFSANLSIASQVAYQPGNCLGLAGQRTVQEAIDRLAGQVSLHKLSGDAQLGAVGQTLARALDVQVANRCGPVAGVPVRFTVRLGGGSVSMPQPVITALDGRASCQWTLGNSTEAQEVEAAIEGGTHFTTAPASVRFTAHVPNEEATERGLRIKAVLVLIPAAAAVPLRLGMVLPLSMLQAGLRIDCDLPIDPATVADGGTFGQNVPRGEPTCFVTVEVPIPLTRDEISLWGDIGLVGYAPVVLAADVKAESNQIFWSMSSPTLSGLKQVLARMKENQGRFGDRILARLTLKGNYIWAIADDGGQRRLYLDGETFRVPAGTSASDVQLPSGNNQRGGDFEMWFWLRADAN